MPDSPHASIRRHYAIRAVLMPIAMVVVMGSLFIIPMAKNYI